MYHNDEIWSVCVTNDNKYIISGGYDGNILIWNFNNDEII